MACERERSTVEITELLRPELPHIQEEVSNPKAPNATALAVLLRELKSHPWKLNSAMRGRWRNPIQATVDREGAFDALPRLPYQLLDAASRAWLFLRDFQE